MRKAFLISALCFAPAAAPAIAAGVSETLAPAPHVSVKQRFDAIRRNDTRSFLRTMLSAEQLDNMSAQWDAVRREKVSGDESAQFRPTMAMLTAPGAEDVLMAMVRPQLAEMRQQMPMFVGMFGGMLQAGIQQDENMSADEKRKAGKAVQAISTFLSENDLADEASAEKAVGIVCSTARRLNLSTLEEAQRLNFNQLLQKSDILIGGLKELFRVYGVDFDSWIDNVKTETVTQTADKATVRVHYEIFGIKDSVDEELVRQGRNWVSVKVAEALAGN